MAEVQAGGADLIGIPNRRQTGNWPETAFWEISWVSRSKGCESAAIRSKSRLPARCGTAEAKPERVLRDRPVASIADPLIHAAPISA
jgi:hypothetical protein